IAACAASHRMSPCSVCSVLIRLGCCGPADLSSRPTMNENGTYCETTKPAETHRELGDRGGLGGFGSMREAEPIGRLPISMLLGLPGMKPECSPLWIHRVHDPVAARNFHRAVQDLAAVCLHSLGGRVDIRNAEVDLPVRRHVRHLGRLVHHAADH